MKKESRSLTPIAAAVALLVTASTVQAQQAQQAQGPEQQQTPEQVTVVGVRAALQKSLQQKRDANSDVEVVTAEDVGKMPDKNVADALQRVPGVNTSSQAAGEGGFDENDRVSVRGTSASLTQTTINGHAVASGDWFILDQYQTVGRSVSYTLFPSELVSSVVVYKGQTADLLEGGVSGSVDIITHTPLQFKDKVTAEATVGGVYATLPKKADPQFNGLVSWKNDENTFGVLIEAFDEKRHVERYGQEELGYAPVKDSSALGTAHPDTVGLLAPTLIGSAWFEQVRTKTGGDFAIDFKPSKDLSFDLNGFYSHMQADNSNINFLADTSAFVNGPNLPTSYTVANGTITSAAWGAGSTGTAAVVDNIYRKSEASSKYLDLDGKYRVNNDLTVSGKVGTSTGVGNSPSSYSWEGAVQGNLTYQLRGDSTPALVSFPKGVPESGAATSWLWNDVVRTTDKENYGKLDALLTLDAGVLESLKFGAYAERHTHVTDFPLLGSPSAGAYANTPAYGGGTYPSNFGSVTGGAYPGWYISQAAVTNFWNSYGNGGPSYPANREYWIAEENVAENDSAAYIMGNLAGDHWSGNIGLRLAHTDSKVLANIPEPGTPNQPIPAGDPAGTINSSLFGDFYRDPIEHSYNSFLPSLNLKFDLRNDLVARFGVANTMSRPDYSALGGAIQITDLTLTGTGGNANLKPVRSTNWDGTLEWYFAPRSLLSATLFYMDFQSYVDFGISQQTFLDQTLHGVPQTYYITSPFNTSATNKGVELAYEQAFGNGFGVQTNYTYANGRTDSGGPMVGNAKNTYNLTGYWEGGGFSARLAYTYRSSALIGLDRSTAETAAAQPNLAASLNYDITKKLSVSLNALNLNNAPIELYANNPSQPRAMYFNGTQYYLTLHAKL